MVRSELVGWLLAIVVLAGAGCRVSFDAVDDAQPPPDDGTCPVALFSSRFASGGFDDFDGMQVTGAASVVGNDGSNPSSPPYNLKATIDAGIAYVYKGGFSAYPHLFVSASNVSFSAFADPGIPIPFGGFQYDVSYVYARFGVIVNGAAHQWFVRYAADGSYYEASGGVTPPQSGVNYTMKEEVQVSSGSSTDGYVKLYVDGTLQLAVTNISNNQRTPTQAWVGYYNDTGFPSQIVTVTADDLVVSETDPDACP